MKIGLIDVDGHNFPNLALMRISAWHKAQGDEVEWWWTDFIHYDIVYMSKIFSDAYSPDVPEPMNADKVIKGGTGYCISLGEDGKEHFDQSKNHTLPPEIEKMFPDYSIYPQFDMRLRTLHFAWDNPKDDLKKKFRNFAKGFRRKSNIGMVYCLTNYNSTMEENLYRIYTLRDLGYDPYVMVYDKPRAPKEIRDLQRWCNNKIIFKKVPRFKDYSRSKG